MRVVDAIAAHEGVDPVGLTPPLHEVIDLEALENLFDGCRRSGLVRFSYNGYEVEVFSTGAVLVFD